jgi:catechol 2,3-dioxygenase-like lactoylglutathione lyase family enzyme
MSKVICGIQQIGIGVSNLYDAWRWYIKAFGVDVRIFEDDTVAELMLPYTGGKPQKRHAALAINLEGGGGFEIWQYSQRTPLPALNPPRIGDFGIFAAKIKCFDADIAYSHLKGINAEMISTISKSPSGQRHFYINDPYGNTFEIIETKANWFKKPAKPTGATYGAIIGVSDIDKALPVYQEILGFDKILSNNTGNFIDLASLPGGNQTFRRVILTHSSPRKGPFSKMFGDAQIELIQALERKPVKIYENRFWGDLGFIHLCFDIRDMKALEDECKAKGFPFTVNSNVKHSQDGSFDMGEAAGHFSYIEDPNGTLIEFVETHKVPILKKFGVYLNLNKRSDDKPLPNWIINMLGLKRVKNL